MANRKSRNFKREYRLYHGKPEQKKRRAERNAARNKLKKAGVVRKGDGKDVHHKNRNTSNNSRSNLSITSKKSNRSFSRKGEKGHGPRKGRK